MHRSRAVTVWQALGTTAAVLVTSAALALPAAAGTGAPAPRSARPAATGTFTTWPQAETAARFPLHRPTRLHGLHRAGPVRVHGVTGKLYGACLGSCRQEGVLDLIWTRNGTFCEAKSVSEPQHVLLNFARHLHQVA